MVKIYDLDALRQKSFYGKAKIYESETDCILFSYETKICGFGTDGKFKKYWTGYSVTTMKHINAFCSRFGFPSLSKKEWDSLPVED